MAQLWGKYTISCQEDFVAIRTTSSLLVHRQLETLTIRVYLDSWYSTINLPTTGSSGLQIGNNREIGG